MILKFEGELEIDTLRGVVYFHSSKTGLTLLRISRLPVPIPTPEPIYSNLLDISTDEKGKTVTSWKGEIV